jgi:hypothetical protein
MRVAPFSLNPYYRHRYHHRSVLVVMTIVMTIVMALLAPAGVLAQGSSSTLGVVKGTFSDKLTREAIIGANIILTPREEARADDFIYAFQDARATLSLITGDNTQNQRRGGIVARDGSFVIASIKPGRYTLSARAISHRRVTQEIVVEAGQTLVLNLLATSDATGVDAVVVTGVASRTQRSVAETAVGRINAEEITQNIAFSDPTQLILGKVSGVYLQSSSGAVGAGVHRDRQVRSAW